MTTSAGAPAATAPPGEDVALWAAVRDGDAEAIAELYHRHVDQVGHLALDRLPDGGRRWTSSPRIPDHVAAPPRRAARRGFSCAPGCSRSRATRLLRSS
jgi:hypothetical protein